MRAMLVPVCCIAVWAVTAPGSPAAPDLTSNNEQWCPGQPWRLDWGVN